MYVHKPLRVKNFHGVSAGNIHEYSLKSRIGKVRRFPPGVAADLFLATRLVAHANPLLGRSSCRGPAVAPRARRPHIRPAECGAHLRGGRRAEGLTAAAAGEAAWFGGAKRVAEPGCERSERRVLADARSVSARTPKFSSGAGWSDFRPRKPSCRPRLLQRLVRLEFRRCPRSPIRPDLDCR